CSVSLLHPPSSSFFFHAPPPTQIYTLSLHDALPISSTPSGPPAAWYPPPIMPPTGWVPLSGEENTRPPRKSWATPPFTRYSPIRHSPSQPLAATTGAMAPPGEHAGRSCSTPSAAAACGQDWHI